MKRFLFTIFLLGALSPLAAQLYHPGEQLFYRVSYKAKMFPNTEVGTVEVKTSEDTADGKSYYKVEGAGRTLPTYRWFFNLEDVYTVWIDTASLRPVRFESDIREGDYTFQSYYTYPLAEPQKPLQREADGPDGREHGPHRALLQPAVGPSGEFPRR